MLQTALFSPYSLYFGGVEDSPRNLGVVIKNTVKQGVSDILPPKFRELPPFFNYYIHILIFQKIRIRHDITLHLHCSNYLELIGVT